MSVDPNAGALSGSRWNALREEMLTWFYEEKEKLTDAFLADGFPPFQKKVPSPYLVYLQLVGWRDSNDPRFTANPQAQAALAQLALQYGMPPPLALNPLQGSTNPTPGQTAQAGWRASQGMQ